MQRTSLRSDPRDVADSLARLADELGSSRSDVCGQRLVEIRAWERAAARAPEVVAHGGEAGFVAALVTELAPLIETVNVLSRRPRSALWRGAGDRMAQALLLAGSEAGRAERGEEAARRALDVPGPLSGTLRVESVRIDGRDERVQIRNGCCLWYRIPGEPHCAACPLLEPDRRPSHFLAER